jgi:apolipoprotein N-acyltransferase
MTKPVLLARLLGLGGVLETVAGLGLLVDPAGGAMALFGSSMEGPGVAIGRIGGGGLLALGIACWLARKTPTAPASVGVAWGYLVYNVVTCVTLAWASVALAGGSLPALGASALHGILGAAVLVALLGRGQDSVGS